MIEHKECFFYTQYNIPLQFSSQYTAKNIFPISMYG